MKEKLKYAAASIVLAFPVSFGFSYFFYTDERPDPDAGMYKTIFYVFVVLVIFTYLTFFNNKHKTK